MVVSMRCLEFDEAFFSKKCEHWNNYSRIQVERKFKDIGQTAISEKTFNFTRIDANENQGMSKEIKIISHFIHFYDKLFYIYDRYERLQVISGIRLLFASNLHFKIVLNYLALNHSILQLYELETVK